MAIDWTAPMAQTFEYFEVDPGTWRDRARLDLVGSCSISRDAEADTLGSASMDVTGGLTERYVRCYMSVRQGGERERVPMGTFLAQPPSTSHDGRRLTSSVDAYTPLIELKEDMPPLGFHIPEGADAMAEVARLASEHARCPVVPSGSTAPMPRDFVANADDTWLGFLSAAADAVGYALDLDEMGRIVFRPARPRPSAPLWTFAPGNSSIVEAGIDVERDMFGVPNAVEAVWSEGGESHSARAVNDDPNSATSVQARGRVILHREENPEIEGAVDGRALAAYAESKLAELSAVRCRATYTHGYCPVRVGDCVRLDHPAAGLDAVCARVVSQDIDLETGCRVQETAEFEVRHWRPDGTVI